MNESFEIVASDLPFVVRRVARWSDCDPAGVVYAGNYPEYLMGAVFHFVRSVRGGPGRDVAPEVGLPCKHLELTFENSVYPDDVLEIAVGVADIRTHTFDIVVDARLPDGRRAFKGMFSAICILADGPREKVRLPDVLRRALEPHLVKQA